MSIPALITEGIGPGGSVKYLLTGGLDIGPAGFSRPSSRSGPRLVLPPPPETYDPNHEAQMRAAIVREDGNNLKRGQDVDVGGAKFILTASDGTRFQVTISSSGVISTVAL